MKKTKSTTSIFRREPRAAAPEPVPAAAGGIERYIVREMSWLAFNRRVLEEAEESGKPLIERCKFAAIVSSNLDEFVMVRLAEIHAQVRGPGADPATQEARRQATPIREQIREMVEAQYRCWREQLVPLLAKEGFTLVPPAEWADTDRESLRAYYRDQLEAILTPLAVDPARPFPVVVNRGITVAVALWKDDDEPTADPRRALVAVPGGNRLIALVGAPGRFALVEDVVMTFLDRLFPGYRISGRCLFRITRDGTLEIDEDQANDLLTEIEQELSSRDHGHAVRLEVAHDADRSLNDWLAKALDLHHNDVVPINGPLDLTFLFGLGDRLDQLPAGRRDDLRDRPIPMPLHPAEWDDPFAYLREREALIHHPYQSFQRVVELVERAADDPKVLALKQTLYRTSGNSPFVRALVRAARNGKQVTVLVELKARFDEAANIRWARALEEAGAHVVYGLVGYKVHAKLLLIIRKEEDGIRRYCHLGTGNYNDRTARLYTDLSYLTANEAVCRDVAALFNMLTGYSQPPDWERLAVAPLTLRSSFVAWIRREAAHAKAGRPGRIIAKFNALVDEGMVDELYAASAAGVEIDLIVRGMCILRAGVPGLSEHIRVRSIVGRFLEHSRIYHFANAGEPVYAISSADWMGRNLDRRVEDLVMIEAPELQATLARVLDHCLADNTQARLMQPDGTYLRLQPAEGQPRVSCIDRLVEDAAKAEVVADAGSGSGLRFVPRRKNDAE